MRGKLTLAVSAIALTLISTASLTAFILELLGPRHLSALIAFGSLFLMSFYPIAVVAAFLLYMSLGVRRARRELARKKRGA